MMALKNNNVALVMPFFGKLPGYFDLYLSSLAKVNMDVLFVSDLRPRSFPSNLKILQMSFHEVRALAAEKLGVPVALETPKKLCDFKPMYGKIFEDYLKGYDYWAFGDCDLVYGLAFNEHLKMATSGVWDVVSMRKLWVAGSCCILRNTEKIVNLYLRANNWQEMVSERGENNLWDECGGCFFSKLESGELTMGDCQKIRDSFGAVVFRSPDLKVFHDDRVCESKLIRQTVMMDAEGRLTINGVEIPIFHYIHVKGRGMFVIPADSDAWQSGFLIERTGFYALPISSVRYVAVKMFRISKAAIKSGWARLTRCVR